MEHECMVDAFAHVGPRGRLDERVAACRRGQIGAGAAVTCDVRDRDTVGGVPARLLKGCQG